MKSLTLQERIWKELKKYGIHNEKELDEELEKMELINITCFTSPLNDFDTDTK